LVVDLYWLHLVIVLVGITVRPADAVRFCVVLGYLELNVIKHVIWSNVHRMVNQMFEFMPVKQWMARTFIILI